MKQLSEINALAKKYKKQYASILSAIKKYNQIGIYRHVRPDYDALGTQFGFGEWIKTNFPNKDVRFFGDTHPVFVPRLYPKADNVSDSWFEKPFLAIVVDAATASRISDPRYSKADFIIRIDHHPKTEDWGNVEIIDPNMGAAAELVGSMLLSFAPKYQFNNKSATYLYEGIVGDTGGFKFPCTKPHTFEVAANLVKYDVNISDTVLDMYKRANNEIEIEKFILDTCKITEDGVAYYIMNDDDLKRFGLSVEQGKDNVNIFHNIEGIEIWFSLVEDKKENLFRVSIRSMYAPINKIAADFRGGGHPNSSGATIYTSDELKELINRLNEAARLQKLK